MSTIFKNPKALLLIIAGALFTGISAVVSGIVLFKVFLSTGNIGAEVPVQVYFVVGVVFQFVIATLVLFLASGRIFKIPLPGIGKVLSDINAMDFTTHVYATTSAMAGVISILLIVLPSYGKYGVVVASILYVATPALANGVVDLIFNVHGRTRLPYAGLLLVSLFALSVTASKTVIDLSSLSTIFSGFNNIELILGLIVFYGIFSVLGDQTLMRGTAYSRDTLKVLYPAISFSYLRIVWMAFLGVSIALVESISHGGLQSFATVLKDAIDFRLIDLLLLVGIVHMAGVLINFVKSLLLSDYKKNPSEVAIGFGISSIVAFGITRFLITYTHGLTNDTVDGSTTIQKIIATIVIIATVAITAWLKDEKPNS